MARTRVGVDVGSTAVRVAEVAAGDIPVLVRAAQVPLPPGAVEAGEIRDPEPVAHALREALGKAGVKTQAGPPRRREPARRRSRDRAPVAARERAARHPRVPGPGVHPDGRRRRGAGLRCARRDGPGRPEDAADPPGRGTQGHGERARAGGARGKARAARHRSRAVRRGARGRDGGRGSGPRDSRRRGRDRRRRARDVDLRPRPWNEPVRPDAPFGWPRHHAGGRGRARCGGRRRGTTEAGRDPRSRRRRLDGRGENGGEGARRGGRKATPHDTRDPGDETRTVRPKTRSRLADDDGAGR